jgi:hypothetical protein
MSVSNDSNGSICNGRLFLSPTFLDFCAKVRNSDPCILPEVGKTFKVCRICEKQDTELADALLENMSITYLRLDTAKYKKKLQRQWPSTCVPAAHSLERGRMVCRVSRIDAS